MLLWFFFFSISIFLLLFCCFSCCSCWNAFLCVQVERKNASLFVLFNYPSFQKVYAKVPKNLLVFIFCISIHNEMEMQVFLLTMSLKIKLFLKYFLKKKFASWITYKVILQKIWKLFIFELFSIFRNFIFFFFFEKRNFQFSLIYATRSLQFQNLQNKSFEAIIWMKLVILFLSTMYQLSSMGIYQTKSNQKFC